MPRTSHSATKASSVDDFRDVIDDLTIENRKLKDRLRKYEASYSAHLEKDKLFEVKIHGLPSEKKRELEEALRSFAANIGESSDTDTKVVPRNPRLDTFVSLEKTPLLSSISQLVDSAYASGPTSTPTLNQKGPDRDAHNQQNANKQNIRSSPHSIPEGLLPKHPVVMTEGQKKELIVRRLEQLFTGKKGSAVGEYEQSLQQHEVSELVAMADGAASPNRSSMDGLRGAPILTQEIEVATKRSPRLADVSILETDDLTGVSDSPAGAKPDSFLKQRPTRPLDLDPDRAQSPSFNAEYIRHLGVSGPTFERGVSDDVGAVRKGWTYLNLLSNMAQLHILNVTPDFVRSAVADVSDKLQLSRDGRKVRWRGGTDGARLSRDSDSSSRVDRSMDSDSDSPDEVEQKRRKTSVGRLASDPIDTKDHSEPTKQPDPLSYKLLFHHRQASSEGSSSNNENESGYEYADESGTGRHSRLPRFLGRGSHSMSGSRALRRNNGPIAFYSGALFCTDLSGDRGINSPPLHETAIGGDSDSNQTVDALGCSRKVAPTIARTPSGSSLPFRPFKHYSTGSDPFQTSETCSKRLDLVIDEDSDIDIPLHWASRATPAKDPLELAASGLGGTIPADHFTVRVTTRRTILARDHSRTKPSKSSALGHRPKRTLSIIPRPSPEKSHKPEHLSPEDILASELASLHTSPLKASEAADMAVQTEIVSAKFTRLQPSALPPPLGYYATLSDSESDSDFSDSSSGFSGVSHLRGRMVSRSRSYEPVSGKAGGLCLTADSIGREQDLREMEDDDDDDNDSDSEEN